MTDEPRRPEGPRNPDRVIRGLLLLCALVFLADLLSTGHPHFPVEDVFGFHALYGFAGSVVLALAAGRLRRVLMRGEDYYDPPERTADDD
ncbi:MAG: hypothetical protein FWJ90_11240 [Actinomadura sp.]